MVGLAVAAGLTGCGDAKVKTVQFERPVTEQFAAQGIQLRDVSCMDDTKAKPGAKISCTAKNAVDTKMYIEGRVTAIEDKRAMFRVVGLRGEAKGTVIAADVVRIARAQGLRDARSASCPSTVPVPTAGTVTCGLTRAGGKVYDAKVSLDTRSRATVVVAKRPR